MIKSLKRWFFIDSTQRQSFVIGLTAFSASLLLFALISILSLIVSRGLNYFWPEPIYTVVYQSQEAENAETVYGQIHSEHQQDKDYTWWVRYSNSQNPFGSDALIEDKDLISITLAKQVARIQLKNGRVVFGQPEYIHSADSVSLPMDSFPVMYETVTKMYDEMHRIRRTSLASIHEDIAELDQKGVADDAPARQRLMREFNQWQARVEMLEAQSAEFSMYITFASGEPFRVAFADIETLTFPGQLSNWQKFKDMGHQIGRFLSDSPKQANTSGGVFPALFGTILMVLLMTVIVAPFGVLAAVYLNEYAPNNTLTSIIRISVSNMAGVPSIVYGVFGLGFFVYTLGGSIDSLFFSDALPAPTFGSPGLFWASLTMALLTLPVVIVSTEEGLRRVPDNLRSGSYALGATHFETIWHTVLPMASPGIMTGIILAIARAAGEVAPLMLVGAVKFAPALPIDGEFPYLHLERQFMHLGVLIYDGAFHSQTNSSSASMMFAACLLLLVVVFVLNIAAVVLRTRFRRLYT